MKMNISLLNLASALAAALILTCSVSQAQTADELIASGDVFDLTFQSQSALNFYLAAVKLEPDNVSLLLRIARQYRDLMSDAVKVDEKLKLGNLSLDYALRAAALAPENSEAQLSPAISYGKMVSFQGSKEKVDASPRIKAAADKALKLDPRNDSAWHILGRWHQSLANVSGLKRTFGKILFGSLPTGTNAESIVCFEKAIEINPHRLRHYIEAGCTYAQMGDDTAARRFLEKGLAMPNTEKDDPAMKVYGREALAKLP